MSKITVIGSGASGIHFALSALKKGHEIIMLDVGFTGPKPVNPDQSFNQLKCRLKDPVKYFLGEDFGSVVPPDYAKEIYGFPPNKQYIFQVPPQFKEKASGFEPLFSFATGGLAQAWTGGSYPFNDTDLKEFPFDYKEIEPFYDEISDRIGIIGTDDDLADYFPMHKNLLEPIRFDTHSQLLVDRYQKKRDALKQKHGISLGRSRVAVLSADKNGRKGCDYSGRCLWGCPTQSLYVPAVTMEQCKQFPGFTYVPNQLITHFNYDDNHRISTVVAYDQGRNQTVEHSVETLVLAAGALSSSKIYLDSVFNQTGEIMKLHGLMDNRQVLVPFITPGMLGKSYNPESYQYHQLAIGFDYPGSKNGNGPGNGQAGSADVSDYVHGQVTTLKTALMQPVLQTMPLDWKTATFLGRNLHSALGVVNINYSDTRRDENYVTIQAGEKRGFSTLEISYSPPQGEDKKVSATLKKVKKFFSGLGAIVPPGQAHTRPMGASVHYSGTIPMSKEPKPATVSPSCKSNDFENLYIIDGAVFPFLPAKNLTFSLMANAARVAEQMT